MRSADSVTLSGDLEQAAPAEVPSPVPGSGQGHRPCTSRAAAASDPPARWPGPQKQPGRGAPGGSGVGRNPPRIGMPRMPVQTRSRRARTPIRPPVESSHRFMMRNGMCATVDARDDVDQAGRPRGMIVRCAWSSPGSTCLGVCSAVPTALSWKMCMSACSYGVTQRSWFAQTQPGPAGNSTSSSSATDGSFDFRGPAVQGKRGERFIYLTWGDLDDRSRVPDVPARQTDA